MFCQIIIFTGLLVFRAEGCGGDLRGVSGTFTSPNFPHLYDHNRTCEWTITVDTSSSVQLTFHTLDMQTSDNCTDDFVQVYEGPDDRGSWLSRLCSSTTRPQTITSWGNTVFVRMSTDSAVAGHGFNATFTQVPRVCNNRLTVYSGAIESPNFPKPFNSNCSWLIDTAAGSTVSLTFVHLGIFAFGTCTNENVELLDGEAPGARSLGKFCGWDLTAIPSPITSSSNKLRVNFVSYRSSVAFNTGFRLEYTTNACTSRLTSFRGAIESRHNDNCSLLIDTTVGHTVNVTVVHIDTDNDTACDSEYVQLLDGEAPGARSLGKFCGSDLTAIPSPITSSSNKLRVNFVSDARTVGTGFRLEYITNGCGGDLRGVSGTFTSPNFPHLYDHDRTCEWTITVDTFSSVKLTFHTLDMQTSDNCTDDYIQVYEGPDDSGSWLSRLCSSITRPQTITSYGNTVFVRMSTDSAVAGHGFSATFTEVSRVCNNGLTVYSGAIESPNFPNSFHNVDCSWLIDTAAGSTVSVTFVHLDLFYSYGTCNSENVELLDGEAPGARSLGKFCGSNLTAIPSPITSSSNKLRVNFVSVGIIIGFYTGFRLEYTTNACTSRLTSFCGAIESRHNDNCSWLIDTTAGHTVNVTFVHIDTENDTACDSEYVQLLDGEAPGARSLGKFCGSDLTAIPSPITSSSNKIRVNFVSDARTVGIGFRLEYTTNGCGGDLRGVSGTFTSPNFPHLYDHDRTCEWTITVDTSSSVQLTFHTLDMQSSDNCTDDYVQVYEGSDDSGSWLSRLCSSITRPQTITSYGNTVFVRMSTDSAVTGHGFNATFTQVSRVCNNRLTVYSGAIESPNFPNPYDRNSDCSWLIDTAAGSTVSVTFVHLDIFDSGTCFYDNVELLDGETPGARYLDKFCGSNLTAIPSPITSSSNKLTVNFVSYTVHTGFRLEYTTNVNGTWGSWGPYDACSVTCGTGTRQRTRPCDTPALPGGVSSCPGADVEWRTCIYSSCPAVCLNTTITDPVSQKRYEVSATELGKAYKSQDFCFSSDKPYVTLQCQSDGLHGASWSRFQPIQGCNFKEVVTSNITDTLRNISLSETSMQTLTDVIFRTTSVLSNCEDCVELDIVYVADIMQRTARLDNISQETAQNILELVDTITEVNSTILRDSNTIGNATNRIITAIEDIADRIAFDNETNDVLLVSKKTAVGVWDLSKVNNNLTVGLELLQGGQSELTLARDDLEPLSEDVSPTYNRTDAALFLPGRFIRNIIDNYPGKDVRLTIVVFNDTTLFRHGQLETSGDLSHNTKTVLNSKVISARITVDGLKVTDLDNHVVTTVFSPIIVTDEPRSGKSICVFWDPAGSKGRGAWSQEGCRYNRTLHDRDECVCHHLTNFAVLLDLYGQDALPDAAHQTALSVITIIGLSLSIAGLSVTVLSFLLIKKLRQGRHQQTLFHMAVSMLGSWVVFLAGFSNAESGAGCIAVAAMLHYLILVSFMWMLMEGLLQYLLFVKVLGVDLHHYVIQTAIPAWGLPLIPVVTILAIDVNLYRGGDQYCWMSLTPFYYAFLAPVAIIMFINIVFYILVIYSICRRGNIGNSGTTNRVVGIRASFICFIALGLSWVFAFFAIEDARLVFQYLFTLTSTVQGFLVFLAFTARDSSVRAFWARLCCRVCRQGPADKSMTSKTKGSTESGQAGGRRGSEETVLGGVRYHSHSFSDYREGPF